MDNLTPSEYKRNRNILIALSALLALGLLIALSMVFTQSIMLKEQTQEITALEQTCALSCMAGSAYVDGTFGEFQPDTTTEQHYADCVELCAVMTSAS